MTSIPLAHMESHPPAEGKTRGVSGKNGWGEQPAAGAEAAE
jgi:hypothetical protein